MIDPACEGDRDDEGRPHELRSFGRRRGRPLSPRQSDLMAKLLPRLALDLEAPPPAPLTRLFGAEVDEVWLEIGIGGAEHLLWQAAHNPQAGLIGCEPFEEGIAKALSGIEAGGLRNVRLHADDARDVLRWLPDAALDRAFILFPDPWPKRRHVKRRLIQPEFLAELARVVRPGGELRIGTDIGDYLRTILLAFRATPAFAWQCGGPRDWRLRPADWPPTRYEEKALREGRRCYYLRFIRAGF